MDTKGFIAEHSKAKLELYSRYLRAYLAVLLNTPGFDRIVVHDIFAGQGFSANAEKGSAVIAAEVIEEVGTTRNPRRKPISLELNDAEARNVEQLKAHLKGRAFVEFSNVNADTYIEALTRSHGQHSLFFIDPYGYTQISNANLRKLFSQPFSDLLLFVPLYHIYRFLRHGEQSEQMKPIARFLNDFGVDEASAKGMEGPEDFAELVKAAIAKLSGKKWVNKQVLKKRGHNSSYCLFFLTDSILGAQKFLEAKKKAALPDSAEAQMGFEFIEELEQDKRFRPFKAALEPGYVYDNVQLYELGIRHDLRPADVNEVLRVMEKLERITVTNVGAKRRNKKAFYIDYKYYRNSERWIAITLK